jgi:predicted metal-dependent phosphoesterase TrpH
MRYELHCHSYYSRGTKIPWEVMFSPSEVVRYAKRIGLDGIALTDHRVTSGLAEARKEARKQKIVFIPGQEVHSRKGHILALGISERIRNNQDLEESLDDIRRQGGIAVAPHPFDIKKDGLGYEFVKADAVEIFNSINMDQFSNVLAEVKARKFRMPAVVGSDAHSLEMIGSSVNIIRAGSMDDVLKAIKKGSVKHEKRYVSLKVLMAWAASRMSMSYHEIMAYINQNYYFPKSYLAKFMLDQFMRSKGSEAWKILAQIGVSSSKVYGALNFIARY